MASRGGPFWEPVERFVDALVAAVAPRAALRRQRSRMAADLLARHYEAAAGGRRTQGWARPGSDANVAATGALGPTRYAARDVIRNNPYAQGALDTIVDHVVGWGIAGTPSDDRARAAADRWAAWANTTACDADGRRNFAGLQKLALRTVVESGEVLVRRRIRLPADGLPIPLQLQILEPDYLDTVKDGITTETGGRIVQGIEFNPIGQRIGYWLFRSHPGSNVPGNVGASVRVGAADMLHVYRDGRPGQVRGVSWFAPV